MIPGGWRRKRVPVTAARLDYLAHYHPRLTVVATATGRELTLAGRVFVAPLASVAVEEAAS